MGMNDLVMETVSNVLCHHGIDQEIINEVIKDIKQGGDMLYEYSGYSVADSNFHENEKRQIDEKFKRIEKENQHQQNLMKDQFEESLRSKNYAIARRNERIEELENIVNKSL